MKRIFVSYKRVNHSQVTSLVRYIENETGENCWIDLDGVESSVQFASKICNAIDEAEIVLFMHSSAHLTIDYENDYTIKELNYAHAKKKKVILIKLDNTELDNIFLLNYGSKNNIDSRDSIQLKKLIRDIRDFLRIESVGVSLIQGEFIDKEDDNLSKAKTYFDNKLYTEAFRLFKLSAENGSPEAMFYLGRMLKRGNKYNITSNYEEAISFYRKSANLGYGPAQKYIGDYYLNQEHDKALAVSWYRKAANQGDVDAQKALSRLGF